MSKWVRVTDLDTGHRLSVPESAVPHGNYRVLKGDATNVAGEPLPAEHGVAKPAVETTTIIEDGQQAEKKEKANG